jgi:hypothetical protein
MPEKQRRPIPVKTIELHSSNRGNSFGMLFLQKSHREKQTMGTVRREFVDNGSLGAYNGCSEERMPDESLCMLVVN